MLNFESVRNKNITMDELIEDLAKTDLLNLTNEMIDTIQELISEAVDDDVIFVPEDLDAEDPYAENEADVDLAWTLGHVIVHCNASLEESAAIAAELARGVKYHGRSRWEFPWQVVTSISQCQQFLEQNRRMCLASLEMWPDEPHLENYYQLKEDSPKITPIYRYIYGLFHTDNHLGQIAEIVQQAKKAKNQ